MMRARTIGKAVVAVVTMIMFVASLLTSMTAIPTNLDEYEAAMSIPSQGLPVAEQRLTLPQIGLETNTSVPTNTERFSTEPPMQIQEHSQAEHETVQSTEQSTQQASTQPPTKQPTQQPTQQGSTKQPIQVVPSGLMSRIVQFPRFMTVQEADPMFAEPSDSACNVTDASLPVMYASLKYERTFPIIKIIKCVHGNCMDTDQKRLAAGNKPLHTAVCAISQRSDMHHFPHALQHILQCWSMWRRFPRAKYIMMLSPEQKRTMTTRTSFSSALVELLDRNNIILDTTISNPPEYVKNAKGKKRGMLVAWSRNSNIFRVGNITDVPHFRSKAMELIPILPSETTYCGGASGSEVQTSDGGGASIQHHLTNSTFPRIAILNRRVTRRLLQSTTISLRLQEHFHLPYKPPVFYFEDMSYQDQARAFTNVDILIAPHGAQLTGIFFMPRCGSVIEIFPSKYYLPDFFGSLATVCGLHHAHIFLGRNTSEAYASMQSLRDRKQGRADNLCAGIAPIIEAVQIELNNWRACCGGGGGDAVES